MNSLLNNILRENLKRKDYYKDLCKRVSGKDYPLNISGSRGGFSSYLISDIYSRINSPLAIVTSTEQEAKDLLVDLKQFDLNADLFPWWGTMLYKGVAPQSKVFGERARCLTRMIRDEIDIVLIPLRSLLFKLPDPNTLQEKCILLKTGDELGDISENLIDLGYYRVPQVTVPGEFALRGEVLDVYLPGESEATRIVFEFDEIEEIKNFDPVTQRGTGKLDSVMIYPVKEYQWDEKSFENVINFIDPLDDAFDLNKEQILEEYSKKGSFRGEELFFSLCDDVGSNIFDFFHKQPVTIFMEIQRIRTAETNLLKEFNELYNKALKERLAAPHPDTLFISFTDQYMKNEQKINFINMKTEDDSDIIQFPCDPARSFFGNINYLKDELQTYIDRKHKIFIFAESESQAKRIGFMLSEFDLTVIPGHIQAGFSLPDQKITVIQENEIFGRRKRTPASVKKAQSKVIDSFVELNEGDFVVHVNYGIGKFLGIQRIKAGGNERDYITIEYGGEENIFIPIEQVNLVQRFIGQEGRAPRLDKIGGKSWEKKKSKVSKSIEDLADRLVKLYAHRQKARGFSFPKDNDWQMAFEAAFPYQETEDQLRCIDEIKTDMESPRPMDRLVCGDVGYGKTEVALRAAFKAVMGGKQVALLAPTTILAEQHYETTCERFKQFPVKIAMLSRFIDKKEQKETLKRMNEGQIDMLIGTHRILSADIQFKNLGLMIIDEEQRFGVKDKERLKELKHSIDCLTLSATPIPRTLHMSLVKIRDMSLLKTAPRNRLPIETYIQEFAPDVIARAIMREVERGGQVFYLHNRVESLESIQLFLRDLVPDVFVEVAHGQMTSKQLEDKMHRFINGAFQVLVSTTIIENGIDIPNVNTIIIDRADNYGISQLYQLRGRVGRSGKLAYAYLLYPENRALSDIAIKRLQIISDYTDLGSGFKIAMKDLEVRGAGNLLGKEQSGEIHAVGFDMYLRMLDEAVKEKSGQKADDIPDVFMELDYSGYIPESYIKDSMEKMEIYKKIAGINDQVELDQIHSELHDRFGPVPDEVHSLLSLAEIRIVCRDLYVTSIRERRGKAHIEFGKMAKLNFDKILEILRTSKGQIKVNPKKMNEIIIETENISLKEKSEFIRDRLMTII